MNDLFKNRAVVLAYAQAASEGTELGDHLLSMWRKYQAKLRML